MSDRESPPRFNPKPTGNLGRDRNARTLQFACLLFAFTIGAVAVLNTIAGEPTGYPILSLSAAGLVAAIVINRAGRCEVAARVAILSILLTAILLIVDARDGFRSHAMIVFPGLLLISVMLLDRASYLATALIVLLSVAALGIAEMHGLARVSPLVRTPTSYASILYVDLTLLVFALIGSRMARDTETNISDLNSTIQQLSAANLALTQSADALRQSEMKYRLLHESITDGVLAVDLAGHILETNYTFEYMVGYTGEELRRLTYQELTPERWQDSEAQIVAEQVLAKGRSEVYEKEYLNRDGTVFPIESRAYLLRNESKQPIGMWAIVRDISERKRDAQTISEGERRLRIAKDAARLGIYQYDVASGTILWDARVRELWGVEPDVPITIDTFFSGLHPEDRARTQAVLNRALDPAGSGEYYAEYRVIGKSDGRERWVAATGQVFFEDGRAVHMIGTGQDISERKRAEAALRESEERLKMAERIAHMGNWRWDLKTNRITWSEEIYRIFGQPEGYDPTLEGFFGAVAPQDRERMEQRVSDCLAQKSAGSIELQIVRPDGSLRTIVSTSEVLLSEGGMPVRLFGTCQDVSDIRREQEESFARQKLESVGTLAGGIAHDFNNLLGGVLGQAELALAEIGEESPAVEAIKAIRDVAIKGSEIVRQLMIYAGQESESAGPADLSRTVSEMAELLKVSVSKNAVLITDLGQGLPPLPANVAQIRRIVMNLVTNASQAIGDRDGVIRVVTRPSNDGSHLELEVSDNGCGMSQEMQAKVFDPFFTTRSAGHGLGLAVVQGIVRSLDGIIQLASEPGWGTTFRILLPCARAAAEEAAGVPGSAGKPAREPLAATVLIVEDEETLRLAIAKVLRKIGSKVLEAADGSRAIELLRAQAIQIDLILLDLTIPGPSSHDVLEVAAQARPGSKVILTSAYPEEVATAQMSAPMIRGFIRKPFALGDLVQRFRDVLPS
jgi:PAS domain S-box-containing protein